VGAFHGVKKPVVLNVTYRGFTQSRTGFSGEATFKRSEFGVEEWIPLEADEVTILVVEHGTVNEPTMQHPGTRLRGSHDLFIKVWRRSADHGATKGCLAGCNGKFGYLANSSAFDRA
jgi:hypothetical protein